LAIFVFGIGSGFLQQYLLRITFDVLPESAPRVSTSFRVIHNIGCALAVIIAIFFLVKYWLAQWDDLNAGLAYAFYTGLVLTALVLVFASLRAVTGWVSKLKHR
jgi:multidrug transporter EmrE-like cation transporter